MDNSCTLFTNCFGKDTNRKKGNEEKKSKGTKQPNSGKKSNDEKKVKQGTQSNNINEKKNSNDQNQKSNTNKINKPYNDQIGQLKGEPDVRIYTRNQIMKTLNDMINRGCSKYDHYGDNQQFKRYQNGQKDFRNYQSYLKQDQSQNIINEHHKRDV